MGRGREGFALLSVMGIVILVGLLATVALSRGRHDIERGAIAEATAKVRAAADGAVESIAMDILIQMARNPAGLDLTTRLLRIGTVEVTVSLTDEDGLIDLNAAPEPLLATLLTAAGQDLVAAERLAAQIADFRDADGLVRNGGAELAEYAKAGLAHSPANAPFASVLELRQVLGMDGDLYGRIAPVLTVHTGREHLDPAAAPPELVRLLSGGEAGMPQPRTGSLLAYYAPSRRRIFTLTATAAADGAAFTRIATLRLTGRALAPIEWLRWERRG